MEYNIYCDESCHLEHDQQRAMVLGAVWCQKDKMHQLSKQIRALKTLHKLAENFEIKWTKVSPAKTRFYRDVLDLFLAEDELGFRALVVPDKAVLDHEMHNQTHDEWYYKMYFDMLKVIIAPDAGYNIYLDIKDTCGGEKVRKLRDVLANSNYDFRQDIIRKVQLVHSSEIELVQLADLLIGAVSYANRRLSGSTAKRHLVDYLRRHTGYSMQRSTLLRERKFNLFVWHPGMRRGNAV